MQPNFSRRDGELYLEELALADVANNFATPCYVYSRKSIEESFLAYREALASREHLICYAVKASSNIAILNVLARLGAGFDIVSVGELERVLRAGGDPAKVVFSGVAKSADEMARALEVGIHCFNVESEAELELLNQTASNMGKTAPVSLRVNPDVDAQTHPYISTGLKENKFGIAIENALPVYRSAAQMSNIKITGVDCHIGSQLTETAPFLDALDRVLVLVDELAAEGITLEHIDLGGGLGVRYQDEQPPSADQYLSQVLSRLEGREQTLVLEPGRSIVANGGALLTTVRYLKAAEAKNFAIVDAAMNDMIRPALYQAWMDIQPLNAKAGTATSYDVVGPVCETGDFLARERDLTLQPNDVLCLFSAGAYGFTMSSNYNSRPRCAEVMVDGDAMHLIRARETVEDLLRGEQLLPG